MTRDDIIRMAREAGLHSAVMLHLYDGIEAALTDSECDELRRLERFAALVAAAERKSFCAQIADEVGDADEDFHAWTAVDAILARSNP